VGARVASVSFRVVGKRDIDAVSSNAVILGSAVVLVGAVLGDFVWDGPAVKEDAVIAVGNARKLDIIVDIGLGGKGVLGEFAKIASAPYFGQIALVVNGVNSTRAITARCAVIGDGTVVAVEIEVVVLEKVSVDEIGHKRPHAVVGILDGLEGGSAGILDIAIRHLVNRG